MCPGWQGRLCAGDTHVDGVPWSPSSSNDDMLSRKQSLGRNQGSCGHTDILWSCTHTVAHRCRGSAAGTPGRDPHFLIAVPAQLCRPSSQELRGPLELGARQGSSSQEEAQQKRAGRHCNSKPHPPPPVYGVPCRCLVSSNPHKTLQGV